MACARVRNPPSALPCHLPPPPPPTMQLSLLNLNFFVYKMVRLHCTTEKVEIVGVVVQFSQAQLPPTASLPQAAALGGTSVEQWCVPVLAVCPNGPLTLFVLAVPHCHLYQIQYPPEILSQHQPNKQEHM